MAPLPTSCTCPSCTREGQHDPWCTVHLADYEALDAPPCDCGLREGVVRTPELTPSTVMCSIEQRDVVLGLARQVYGEGELLIDVDGPAASVSRAGKVLYLVTSFEARSR